MIQIRELYFILCITLLVKSENIPSKEPVMIRLEPEKVADAFRSAISSNFMKNLANEMAQKAAKHFIDEVRSRQTTEKVEAYDQRVKNEPANERENNTQELLSDKAAMILLSEPSPDGDNLELDSLEETTTVPPIPAQRHRINGVYFRRSAADNN